MKYRRTNRMYYYLQRMYMTKKLEVAIIIDRHEHPKNINININICSIELKWDGKITKIWYDNEIKWIRITEWNGGDL